MKDRIFHILLLLTLIGFLFNSCEDDGYIASEDARLSFSLDTLMFDTIFTTIGTTTKSFRVINPHNQPILVSNIHLAGGDASAYRLNIDGEMSNELSDIEIPAKDSLYIFVELTVDPNGSNQPMIVQDSIIFYTNSNSQDIDLLAWGQDFVPINSAHIKTTTWTAEKPYVIYDGIIIDSFEVLSIDPGAQIYFHKTAAMYVVGAIKAIGTPLMPIVFSGDRLEEMYDDIPDQWQGILIFPSEETDKTSIFENVEIKNANIGLQVGALEYEGSASVKLHNVKIEHMGYAGIFALDSKIEATNTLIADCGLYCVTLLAGGNYNFNHCTIANYWGSYSNRQTASLVVSNHLFLGDNYNPSTIEGDLVTVWKNSIIWGNIESEVEFGRNEDYLLDFKFDHCLMKLNDSTYTSTPDNFISVERKLDPLFIDRNTYDYQLDTLSPAKDAGLIEYGELVPIDLNDLSRLNDDAPDLGVYEWIKKEEEKEE